MKKTTRKLQLSRETLHQLLDVEALGASPFVTFPITACLMNTCPPICTRAKPCAG
jgi:hypothetical protein